MDWKERKECDRSIEKKNKWLRMVYYCIWNGAKKYENKQTIKKKKNNHQNVDTVCVESSIRFQFGALFSLLKGPKIANTIK